MFGFFSLRVKQLLWSLEPIIKPDQLRHKYTSAENQIQCTDGQMDGPVCYSLELKCSLPSRV